MKKLMTMALGLAFALSTVSFAVAQDKMDSTSTKTTKKHKKTKTTDSTDKKM